MTAVTPLLYFNQSSRFVLRRSRINYLENLEILNISVATRWNKYSWCLKYVSRVYRLFQKIPTRFCWSELILTFYSASKLHTPSKITTRTWHSFSKWHKKSPLTIRYSSQLIVFPLVHNFFDECEECKWKFIRVFIHFPAWSSNLSKNSFVQINRWHNFFHFMSASRQIQN